jgi:hypothetical protein
MVTFQSIFPAAYYGRWPHVHFQVYASLPKAVASSGLLATSQIAMPRAVRRSLPHRGLRAEPRESVADVDRAGQRLPRRRRRSRPRRSRGRSRTV